MGALALKKASKMNLVSKGDKEETGRGSEESVF